jgi:hypothetical protein
MKNLVKLSEVVELAKTTGHIGWFKVNDASKVITNASGTLQINTTIFFTIPPLDLYSLVNY